jgi:hypothetical protein
MNRDSRRVARSIRLPPDLWRALDAAALDASSAAGRFRSANALLEEILIAGLRTAGEAQPEGSALERMRAARRQKQTKDRERVDALLKFLRLLKRSSATARHAALDSARAAIDRWRRGRLVSPTYIEVWEQLIAGGLPALERGIREGFGGLGPEALAGNAPFTIERRHSSHEPR